MQAADFSRSRVDAMINLNNPLTVALPGVVLPPLGAFLALGTHGVDQTRHLMGCNSDGPSPGSTVHGLRGTVKPSGPQLCRYSTSFCRRPSSFFTTP